MTASTMSRDVPATQISKTKVGSHPVIAKIETTNEQDRYLDFWRVTAAVAVLWPVPTVNADIGSFSAFTRFAIPTFLTAAGFLACRARSGTSFGSYFKLTFWRMCRVLVEWLLIVGIQLLISLTLATADSAWNQLGYVLISRIWVLPFLFVAMIAAHWIGQVLAKRGFLTWPIAHVLVAVSTFGNFNASFTETEIGFFQALCITMAYLSWGILLAITSNHVPRNWLCENCFTLKVLLLFLTMETASLVLGRQQSLVCLAIIYLLAACYRIANQFYESRVDLLATLAFSVFFCQQFFMQILTAPQAGFDHSVAFQISAVSAFLVTAGFARIRTTYLWL